MDIIGLSNNVLLHPTSVKHTIEDLEIVNIPSDITIIEHLNAKLIDGYLVVIHLSAVVGHAYSSDKIIGYIKIPDGKQAVEIVGRVGSADNKNSYNAYFAYDSKGYAKIGISRLTTEYVYGSIIGMLIDE